MTDIVERLRTAHPQSDAGALRHHAADEIARLREANKELAEALNVSCAALRSSAGPDEINYATKTARASLAKHKGEQK